MRDCFDILITKYYAALNGNITYNSANVPIYDRVPKNTTFPYIIFQSYTGVDESNKSNYMKEVTVTVQVVTGFDLEQGGKEESDNIADQILQIIRERPDNLLDLSPNFNLINVSVDDTSSYEQTTETHLIVYRNIRFRHKVEQLTDYFNTNFLCATAKPTNLTATAVSTSQINLSWTDNSGGVASFSIERSSTYENGFAEIATTTAGTTTYNNTGLTAGVVYFYRVRALNSCYSTYSNIAFDCTQSNGVCADGTVVITDNDTPPTTLYTEVVASGGSATRAINNSNYTLMDSAFNVISTDSILAEGSANIIAPDGTVLLKDTDGNYFNSAGVRSGASIDVEVQDGNISINATPFTTVLAEGTANIPVKNTAADNVGSDNTGVWEVADATIENSDASYSTTVAAEGTKILPDITLTQPNGVGETKKSVINLTCTQINALANVDLISQLTTGQVVAIAEGRMTSMPINPNAHQLHSSVLPAFSVTGDWRDQYNNGRLSHPTYTNLSRVYMLSDALNFLSYTPNPFGHLKRFTGRTGSYYDEVSNTWKDKNGGAVASRVLAFPDGIIYDHYTGRAWNHNLAFYSGINFATIVSNAAALTTHGLTWRVPTLLEFSSIAINTMANPSGLSYSAHFNTTTAKIFTHNTATQFQWTANVDPTITANNYLMRSTTTANLIISEVRTVTTTRGGTVCANFNTSDLTL